MTKLLDQLQTPPTTTCMSDEEFKLKNIKKHQSY